MYLTVTTTYCPQHNAVYPNTSLDHKITRYIYYTNTITLLKLQNILHRYVSV